MSALASRLAIQWNEARPPLGPSVRNDDATTPGDLPRPGKRYNRDIARAVAEQADERWIMSPAALRDGLRQEFPPVDDDRFVELAKQADAVRALV